MEALACVGGCGFYGSPEQHNMCSVCYKVYLKDKTSTSTSTSTSTPSTALSLTAESDSDTQAGTASVMTSSSSDISNPQSGHALDQNAGDSTRPVKKRCKTCNKRVGLLGFECRCGDLFCGTHRYPEEHACDVDYKAAGRETLAKQNPVVVADRMKSRI